MPQTDSSLSRRRLVVIVAVAVAVLLTVGVGIYGLITGPRTDPAPATSSSPSAPTPPGEPGEELPQLRDTDDPGAFAEQVAEALFTWDTRSGLLPLDYTAPLIEVADPSGVDQAGLAADIAAYLPNRETWVELRKYQTRQWIEITDLYVPEAWAEAEAQAQPGQLPPGATAITIEGVRHRAGIWHDDPVTSRHDVAFTIFLACPPEPENADDAKRDTDPDRDGACALLRLSRLDAPLT